jgi:hypothetical protein
MYLQKTISQQHNSVFYAKINDLDIHQYGVNARPMAASGGFQCSYGPAPSVDVLGIAPRIVMAIKMAHDGGTLVCCRCRHHFCLTNCN